MGESLYWPKADFKQKAKTKETQEREGEKRKKPRTKEMILNEWAGRGNLTRDVGTFSQSSRV